MWRGSSICRPSSASATAGRISTASAARSFEPCRFAGIRHHGPGGTRSLLAALEALRSDAVLVEGPPDAADVLPLLARPEMQPPVALLVYPPDAPQDAAYYPFAEFSPEWQALRHAHARGVTARFMDLPYALDLDGEDEESEVREDPIGLLAEAAGYEDRELWWERQVEQRRDATDLFDAILEAMSALRLRASTPRGPPRGVYAAGDPQSPPGRPREYSRRLRSVARSRTTSRGTQREI